MNHLNCLAGKTYSSIAVKFALLIAVFTFCSNGTATSQMLKKPIEGDSLSFATFLTFGAGMGSRDVTGLNNSLKLSNLNTVGENTTYISFTTKQPLGGGFFIGEDFFYHIPTSTATPDRVGTYSCDLVSLEGNLNFGYAVLHNNSVFLMPSAGVTLGADFTHIYNSVGPAIEGYPYPTQVPVAKKLRDEVMFSRDRSIESVIAHLNFSIAMEGYVKLLNFGIREDEVQVKPNKPVNVQNRTDLWLGGYIAYHLLHSSSNITSSYYLQDYATSGLNVGIRLMVSTSLRYVDP